MYRNYADIGSGKRPYGFIDAVVPFNSEEHPCFKITGVAGRHLEVKVKYINYI